MALTANPPAPAGWSRWPQHHPNGEYHDVMMDAGMMPYDSRPTTSAPLQRPLVTNTYFPAHSYTLAPLPAMSPPQYLHGLPPVTFGGYGSFTPSPVLGSPFKPEHYSDRSQLRVVSPDVDGFRGIRDFRESLSPSVKSESRIMARPTSVASKASTSPASSTSKLPVESVPKIVFNTPVDALMKAIQSKSDAETATPSSAATTAQEIGKGGVKQELPLTMPSIQASAGPTAVSRTALPTTSRSSKSKPRKFSCNYPGCGQLFTQNTHLETHMRCHTGEKPYVCSLGCGKRFSQAGNQKIHERRHRGEKPYQCLQCGKKFTQHGTLMAHGISHTKEKRYPCKLDNCGKRFTQRGNLKSHHNKFHSATLEALSKKFATAQPADMSSEDKELWEYFADLYKNSNKGIKGRGKHQKVKLITPTASTVSQPLPVSYHGLPQILNTTPPLFPPAPPHGMLNLAAYSFSRPQHHSRDVHGDYDMFEVEDDSMSGSGASTTYDEEHHRELAFGDRMY